MDFSNYKIGIFTRSMNYSLYKMSNSTIQLPFERHRLTFTSAHGYLYEILKYDVDYAINIDEDAFVVDNDALLKLLEYCITEKIVNCGMRDGGVYPIRYGNPLVTNPFFNILDVKTIKKDFSISKIMNYLEVEINYTKLLPANLPSKYEISNNYEPFYPFFLWLNTNYKVLYLDAQEHDDKFTSILYNHLSEKFIYHSWYSRCYGVETFHTNRILSLYQSCNGLPLELSFFEKVMILSENIILQKIIPLFLPFRRFVRSIFVKY